MCKMVVRSFEANSLKTKKKKQKKIWQNNDKNSDMP